MLSAAPGMENAFIQPEIENQILEALFLDFENQEHQADQAAHEGANQNES